MKKNRCLLFAILLISFLTRFVFLGDYLPVFNRDEAAIGYNSYTISAFGRDEFGIGYPVSFRSFGDYKMPLYIYVVSFLIPVFGVNEFTVRLPSAICGLGLVLVIYLLVEKVFKDKKIGLISAGLLAIAPFHIHYSRIAFEANVALFLIFLGMYLFYLGLKKASFLLLAAIVFSLSLFCYFTPYFFVLPFVFALIVFNLRRIREVNKKFLFLFIVLTILGFLLATKLTILANSAKTNITVFKERRIWEEMAKTRQKLKPYGSLAVSFIGNKYVFYGKEIIINYLKSFSADFLFFKGGRHPWHVVYGMGSLYVLDLVFVFFGFFYLLKRKGSSLIILGLFLFTPLPSAITTDAPHVTRLLTFFVFWLILTGAGINYLWKKLNYKKEAVFFICFMYFVFFGKFLVSYWHSFLKNINELWLYGTKKAALFVGENKGKYGQVFIDDGGESYIYYLFYNKYPLDLYLKTVDYEIDGAGFVHVKSFDKIRFGRIDIGKEKKGSLVITRNKEKKEKLKLIKTISDPGGKEVVFIGEYR